MVRSASRVVGVLCKTDGNYQADPGVSIRFRSARREARLLARRLWARGEARDGSESQRAPEVLRNARHGTAAAPSPMAEERLQKVIARAGVSSRRAAEDLITKGRVRVNGKIVT